jgi:integrase/recombinase XerD
MTVLTTLSLATLIQTFFRQHLIAVRGVSPHTLHAYRDAIRGLLKFAATRHQCSVVELALDHIGRDTVLAFLDHLEQQRGNAAVTRNARLAAIHSLYRFMAAEDPAALGVCHQVVAIPFKRVPARTITCPPRTDIEHLLKTIDRSRALGRRDVALLQFLYNTGARAQETVDVRLPAVRFEAPAQVRLFGKECHSYCISFRRRNGATITHACRQACDLAFSSADVLQAVHIGIGLGPYTVANGAGHVGPMFEPYPA